jgi:hypothetical protein
MILQRLLLLKQRVDAIIVHRTEILQVVVLVAVVLDLLLFRVDTVLFLLQLCHHLLVLALEIPSLGAQMVDLRLSLLDQRVQLGSTLREPLVLLCELGVRTTQLLAPRDRFLQIFEQLLLRVVEQDLELALTLFEHLLELTLIEPHVFL